MLGPSAMGGASRLPGAAGHWDSQVNPWGHRGHVLVNEIIDIRACLLIGEMHCRGGLVIPH